MYAKCDKECVRKEYCDRADSLHKGVVNYQCDGDNDYEWFIGKLPQEELCEVVDKVEENVL